MNSYRIPEMARKYMDYDMIRQHTDLPVFPEFRTHLLYAFLSRHSSLSGYSELFSLVTSLVQIGMDTHDLVSITNNAKETKAARSRQLKVLAGDYFSSRFYYLLSHAGQIELIGILSNAICEVNRKKMNLYQKMRQLNLTADDYIKLSVEIRAQLYLAFACLMEESLRHAWPEVLGLFTRCEVLLLEIGRSESAQQYRDSWGYWHILHQASKEEGKHVQAEDPDYAKLRSIWLKYKITPQLYQMLDSCMKQLQDKLQTLESKELAKELQLIGEPFARYLSTPKALEEI
ncbi:Heptaprenyl diphosphate synthase component 1 [Paenibacillus konkukensis]|uniref:Heptaprenyl diphosphate synthase component 1 n=1 Tax=Paenibacillus konkukensis TaxID=2020716 RepID=A0ABY4RHS5_9BACL|nr:heptaprenyl diphosphate synthase component 1 [Paenibacillus konkukensis]UQZ81927.1 Heptaprenyl diphosphate synthase component 1 [Paenibacillus konkukensis]